MVRLAVTVAAALLISADGRVLITPPTAAPSVVGVVVPAEAQLDEPCDALLRAAAFDEAPELDRCSCYPDLPLACTALLRDGFFVDGIEQCGARVNGIIIRPDSCQGGYYGHDSSLSPELVLEHGLAARGDDWDLIRHAAQGGRSAFRGTTKQVTYPDGGGAAGWADEGGFVYELTCVPSWDVNRHVQGRRMVAELAVGTRRYGGNLAGGEHEHAVPARVPQEHIKRYGPVITSAAGVLFVPRSAWVDNPRWDPCFCRYSLSECDDAVPCH